MRPRGERISWRAALEMGRRDESSDSCRMAQGGRVCCQCHHLSHVTLDSPQPSLPFFDGVSPSLSQVILQTLTTLLWDAPSPPFLLTWRRCPRVWSCWRPSWMTRWAVGRTCSEPRGPSLGPCQICWKLCSQLLERWALGWAVTQGSFFELFFCVGV